MKVCTKCGKDLPLTKEFYHKDKSIRCGFASSCKVCVKARYQRYYALNKEKIHKKHLDWVRSPRGKALHYLNRIKRTYGVDDKRLMSMMDAQGGCCAICKNSLIFPESFEQYHVDHNHNTGEVRGLLCYNCNHGLGMFKDTQELLESAIKYLKEYK